MLAGDLVTVGPTTLLFAPATAAFAFGSISSFNDVDPPPVEASVLPDESCCSWEVAAAPVVPPPEDAASPTEGACNRMLPEFGVVPTDSLELPPLVGLLLLLIVLAVLPVVVLGDCCDLEPKFCCDN